MLRLLLEHSEDVREEAAEVSFERFRRFRGMGRGVVVLVELPSDGDRLDELLYVGLTWATAGLVIAFPTLARRFG